MKNDKNNAYGSKAARGKVLSKVQDDIVRRDRADIDKGYRGSRAFKTSMGDVPLYPDEFGKLSKTDKMAYRDAVRRENRRGDNYSLAEELGIKGETGKGISRAEGDAARKRLIEKYAKEGPKAEKRPSLAASAASGNRMSEENAKDAKAVEKTTSPKRPSIGATLKSAERVGRQERDEMLKMGMKKGGTAKAYAKGGKVSSRADGCAVRGKTKGRMI